MEYLGTYCTSLLSITFVIFAIMAIGYLLGSIEIKGISLGTAGVLVAALAYGVLIDCVPVLTVGNAEIILYSAEVKALYNVISGIGTALFVSSVGLIAGPKFFRMFNRKSMAYILLSILIICIGGGLTALFLIVDKSLDPAMAVGLMTGALTSTPGLSAAKEAAANVDAVVAGYGIAYLFGVLGVVLFVQVLPRLLGVDMEAERKRFVAANMVAGVTIKRPLRKVEGTGYFAVAATILLGCLVGTIKVPGTTFSLGTSGGVLIAGLVIGHFGHIGAIDCRISQSTTGFVRELGLALFLIGAGVPGGVNFVRNVHFTYFVYGAVITLVPMIVGFLLAKYVFKLSFFNNLGAITGGMTSTPALGSLISVAKTEDVAAAYAAAYPMALVAVVLCAKLLLMFFHAG